MAKTWGFTWRNRVPLALLDAAGRLVQAAARPFRSASVRSESVRGGGEPIRRILVIEFWNIGDVVLATPFLAQLRAIFPEASITLLGKPHAELLLRGSGLVDEVITVDFPWTDASRRYAPRRYFGPEMRSLFARLRDRGFDLAFESRMDPRAKLVMGLTRARRRVGYDLGGCNWSLTDVVKVGGLERHRSDDWLRLLETFGGRRQATAPRLSVNDMESAWARDWLRSQGMGPGTTVVAIHPGASMPSKRWPIERFAAVVREIQRWESVRVLVIEDPAGYGGELSRIPGVTTIRPTLRELMAVLAAVDVLVCNDSGPMHIAAAMGTPTVGVFHAHAAREFAPLGSGHRMLAPPPGHPHQTPDAAALLAIDAADVTAATRDVLDRALRFDRATG